MFQMQVTVAHSLSIECDKDVLEHSSYSTNTRIQGTCVQIEKQTML